MRLLDLAHKAHLVDKPVNDCDGNFGRARLAYFAETSGIRKAYLRAANSTLAEPTGHIDKHLLHQTDDTCGSEDRGTTHFLSAAEHRQKSPNRLCLGVLPNSSPRWRLTRARAFS
jgi:hypothetical protein